MEIIKFKPKENSAAKKELEEVAKDFYDRVQDGTVTGFAIIASTKEDARWWQSWPHSGSFEAYGLVNRRLRDLVSKDYWKS